MVEATKGKFKCEINEAPLDDPEELAEIVRKAQQVKN